eukprot:m.674375 g.674375  ORF g.674375 m.674375 type:complete len:86 (+) comp58551_c0_seq2:310-567(+)
MEQQNQPQVIKTLKKARKPKKKKIDGVFAMPLEALVERDRQLYGDKLASQNTPMIFQQLIDFLLDNGLMIRFIVNLVHFCCCCCL